MSKSKPFKSNFIVAPGAYVEEHMEYYGYSYQKFADMCGCSAESVKEIVIDKASLTLELAKKFENVINIPGETLMRIEEDYLSRIKSVVKGKTQEKKPPVVQQSFAAAQ